MIIKNSRNTWAKTEQSTGMKTSQTTEMWRIIEVTKEKENTSMENVKKYGIIQSK